MNINKTLALGTKDYYIGLDIGTNSVGWSAVDTDYRVVRKSRKSLWGVRLFDEGQTAEARRISRIARRRLDRRGERLQLLQSLFGSAIAEQDQGFFQRLRDSFFLREDKVIDQPNTLFDDTDYQDKHFHGEYKTIYHLRHALMHAEAPMDIRLLYLAIHHIIKKRGHFLMKGETLSEVKDFRLCWQSFVEAVDTMYQGAEEDSDDSDDDEVSAFTLAAVDAEQLAELLGGELSTTDKKKALEKLFVDKSWSKPLQQRAKALAELLSGATMSVIKICPLDLDEDEAKKVKICFKTDDYDAKASEWAGLLGDYFYLIERAKAVYDWSVLSRILHDSDSLCEAKIKSYELHKSDLACLKRLMSQLGIKHQFFGHPDVVNYSSYVGYYKKGGEKINCKRCSREDFEKSLKKLLPDLSKESEQLSDEMRADTQHILERLEQGDLLPLQVQKDNAVIPYQVHLEELKKILDRAEQHHPFLREVDEYGTAREKIEKLMTFRIPFYVGPLNDAHKKAGNEGFCWIVRRVADCKEKILPWNFEQLVDRHASAERFMERLSSQCTYIPTEDVLPKCSLLYQRFTVLNEINNIAVHGDRLSPELKQQLYTHVFERYKKVTPARIASFLIQQGCLRKGEEQAITGIDVEIKASLSSHITLRALFGESMPDEARLEQAILLITKLGMDADMLHERMQQLFPELKPSVLKRLCALDASGWGRLSRKLLTDIPSDQHGSLIEALWMTDANLMQLLGSEYGYGKLVDRYNDGCTSVTQSGYKQVADLFLPPAVKRGVWQSLKIIKEVIAITGKAPQKIFIEVARGPEEKKRTISRRIRLQGQYKKAKLKQWADEIERYTDGQFKSDRLYLYFTQMGRCMYTGKEIDLDKLSEHYDIDHIQPISKTADDSLDNRVLVLKKENGRKSDVYPIDQSIRQARASLWQDLEKKGLISRRKYDRLMRDQPLSDEELAGFINRQLVETRQSTKAVGKLLERLYPETRVVYVKGGNVSRFRQLHEFIKLRELNDYHHGKDAYLSCVVGNVYDERFTRNVMNFVKTRPKYNLKVEKIFARDIETRGQLIWRSGDEGSITVVREMMQRHDLLVTRKLEVETGDFFDQNIVSKRKGLFPIKSSDARLQDTARYGGYDKTKGAYFFLVEHKKGKKRLKTIEFVPVRLLKDIESDTHALDSYCKDQLGLLEPRILVDKIPMQSMFKIDGVPFTLCGRSSETLIFNHCVQFVIPSNLELILKKVIQIHAVASNKEAKLGDAEYLMRKHELKPELCLELYDYFISKLESSIYGRITPSPLGKARSHRNIFLTYLDKKALNKYITDDVSQILARQCKDIVQLLAFFQCNATIVEINKEKLARIRFTKNITDRRSVILIHQSITGFYEYSVHVLEL